MIIYGELLFIENMIIGGVLLYITGMIHGNGAGTGKARFRLLIGSLMCGGFSMVIFLGAKGQQLLLMEAVFAVTVCMVTFGGSCAVGSADNAKGEIGTKPLLRAFRRIPWRYALTFILVTYFMGGMTMGLLFVTDNTGIYTAVGIYTGDMRAGLMALFVGIASITAKQVIKTVKSRKFYREHVFDVKVAVEGVLIGARGFFDTGNGLRDPVSGKPAAVADEMLWEKLESADVIVQNRFCVIPCETINGKSLLMAIRTDFIELNGERVNAAVLAKGSEAFFSEDRKHAECCLLLSRDMIKGGL